MIAISLSQAVNFLLFLSHTLAWMARLCLALIARYHIFFLLSAFLVFFFSHTFLMNKIISLFLYVVNVCINLFVKPVNYFSNYILLLSDIVFNEANCTSHELYL